MKTMAHIVDGKIVNVSLWDGSSEWNVDSEVVEIPEGVTAGIGWDYVDGAFVDNRPLPALINIGATNGIAWLEEGNTPEPWPDPTE